MMPEMKLDVTRKSENDNRKATTGRELSLQERPAGTMRGESDKLETR